MLDKALFRLKGVRPLLLLHGWLSLMQAAAIVIQAISLSKGITMLFHGQSPTETLKPLLLFALAFAARHTLVWLQRKSAGHFAETYSKNLRLKLLERLFERGPAYASLYGSGRLVTISLDGIQRFRTYLELTIPRALDMVVITFTLLGCIYWFDPISGLILTVTMPVLIIFFILLGYAARSMADKEWRAYQILSHHFTDALRGLETLRFLRRSRSYANNIDRVSNQYRLATMRTLRVAFLSSFALDFFSTLSVAFVAVSLGLRLINGNIGLEAALAILLLAPEYFTPVRMLGADYHASLDGKEAWHAVRDMLSTSTQTDKHSLEVHDQKRKLNAKNHDKQLTPRLPGFSTSKLTLAQISVHNDEQILQLSDITATAAYDVKKIGIVGMSGAGKTTLLQLISGWLQPSSGSIMINDTPLTGDIKTRWQQQLAFIPQHPYIFSGTLADNIRFYDPLITDKQIERVLVQTGLDEIVQQLPEGIHTQIGEGGRTFSGGQAQRIALARALAGNRSVLLLDEPTAHLDIQTELELKQTMLSVFKDRRVFLATHRLHWMKDMDWIWVLKDGRLVGEGTHMQLIAHNSYYRELFQAATGGASIEKQN